MSMTSDFVREVTVRIWFTIDAIVTIHAGNPRKTLNNRIMAHDVTRPSHRQWDPAGQFRPQLRPARHLLPPGGPGEPHQRRPLPGRHLDRWSLRLDPLLPLVTYGR